MTKGRNRSGNQENIRHANRVKMQEERSAGRGKRNQQQVVEDRWAKKDANGRVVRDADHSYVKPPISAKNEAQKLMLQALKESKVVVFIAPAGVGKSFITMSECTDWLKKGIYHKLTIARPSVGMGKTLGLLKGDLRQKYEPYLGPLLDVVKERYGFNFYDNCVNNGTIELMPLEYLRGKSFDNLIIIDEVQNSTPDEMYTILTRLGEGKLILLGDLTQSDIKGENGLAWLEDFIYDNPELDEYVTIVSATSDDIVRSGFCKLVVKARERSLGM